MSDTTKLGDPKSGLASLVRPHFTAGLLLQDDDLTAGVTYTRTLSRLMFRTLFGCGVMCGLKVTVDDPPVDKCGNFTLLVEKGLALDCVGDPVEVPNDQSVTLNCATDIGTELWVALRRYDKCCAPRTAVCSEDAEPPSVCTRERDGFEIQVFSERPCSCGCSRLAEPDVANAAAAAAPAAPAAATAPKKAAAKKKTTAKTANVAGAVAETVEPLPDEETDCKCNHRHAVGACYHDFYEGKCPCECCDCEWILLAVAERANTSTDVWTVDHSVRRFIRPVLMRDPLAPV
jgi:hypothetical protein